MLDDKEKQMQLIYEKLNDFKSSFKELDNRLDGISNSFDGLKNGLQKQQGILLDILNTLDKHEESRKNSIYSKPYSDGELEE